MHEHTQLGVGLCLHWSRTLDKQWQIRKTKPAGIAGHAGGQHKLNVIKSKHIIIANEMITVLIVDNPATSAKISYN